MTGSDPISARYHGTLTSGSRMVRATWLMVPRVGVVARSDAAWVAVISRPLPSRAPADPASPQCRPGAPEQTRAVRADGSAGSAALLRLPSRTTVADRRQGQRPPADRRRPWPAGLARGMVKLRRWAVLSSHEQQIRDDSGQVHAAKAEAPALPGTRRPVRSAAR